MPENAVEITEPIPDKIPPTTFTAALNANEKAPVTTLVRPERTEVPTDRMPPKTPLATEKIPPAPHLRPEARLSAMPFPVSSLSLSRFLNSSLISSTADFIDAAISSPTSVNTSPSPPTIPPISRRESLKARSTLWTVAVAPLSCA